MKKLGPRAKRIVRALLIALAVVFALGLVLPDSPIIPVAGANASDWNHDTFWHHPWGKSGVHKGIDIFANEGKDVTAAVPGLVVYSGGWGDGGNVVAVLGPKWRLHYYAHMSRTTVSMGAYVSGGDRLGAVGTTGNAAGKPPHLHYSIVTTVPYPWRMRFERQGWKKAFFLDPHAQLTR